MRPIKPAMVPRVALKARLQWDESRQRYVLLYPEGLVALNSTAGEILGLCDGVRSVGEVVETLRQRYTSREIEQDVVTMLQRLAAKGLVTHGA